MPRPKDAIPPNPGPKPAYRKIVNSPWNKPTGDASSRTRREREAAKHDGLCITELPSLSGCRCNCTRCWDKAASKVICSADPGALEIRSA